MNTSIITTAKTAIKAAANTIGKNAPIILTGVTVIGTITSIVLSAKATANAVELVEEKKKEEGKEELSKGEIVETVWREYIPVAVAATTTIVCSVAACSINAKRQAALVSAYTLAKDALKDYKDANVKANGLRAHQNAVSEQEQQNLAKAPITSNNIIDTGNGQSLCKDALSGQYFYSSRDAIEKAFNELNAILLRECRVGLNEWYDLLGIGHTELGDHFAWDIDDGIVESQYDCEMSQNGSPILIVGYYDIPRYKYKYD